MIKTKTLATALIGLLLFSFQNCAGPNEIESNKTADSTGVKSPPPSPTPGSTPLPTPLPLPAPQVSNVPCSKILTSGSSWTVPSDWNSNSNTIEAIGNGSDGGGNVRGGGGGGAYSRSVNVALTPGTVVGYSVAHQAQILTAGNDSGDSYFCNSSANCSSIASAAVVVSAQGGMGSTNGYNLDANGGVGGNAAYGIATGPGAIKYSGGNGGNCASLFCGTYTQAGSGGGAAGPHGNGLDGNSVGTGGLGDAGVSGGSSGNGGGTAILTPGSNGGNYGGGAGGGGDNLPGGAGGGGLIIISYLGKSCS